MQTLTIVAFLVAFLILSLLVSYHSLLTNQNYLSNIILSESESQYTQLRVNLQRRNTSNWTTNSTQSNRKQEILNGNEVINPHELVKCSNQSNCIRPRLQLKQSFNIYYCKHINYGIRFYYLVREGLLLHPKINLVSRPELADYIVYLPESSSWQHTECNNRSFIQKIIALDEGDYPDLFRIDEGTFMMTFKRSYVKRVDGNFKHYMPYIAEPNVFPMTYIVAEIYVRHLFKHYQERSIEILCSLRAIPSDPTRTRVKNWVDEYIQSRGIKNAFSGEVNTASRPTVSKQYFERMYSSKIIVTSNPSNWEGDFRLCEALATGALIFVDEMYVPRQHPFEHGKHLIFYNNHNKSDFFQKLDYYRLHHEESKRIAMLGYLHAMHYHRATNLIDYVFRTLHTKMIAEQDRKFEHLLHDLNFAQKFFYSDTGYALRLLAIRRQKQLLDKKR